MRQSEYITEKNTYKSPAYIQKQDKKYKKIHPCHFRFHIFVKLKIVFIKDNVATVIYEKHTQQIILQNMDSFFYLNEVRKKSIEEQLKMYRK